MTVFKVFLALNGLNSFEEDRSGGCLVFLLLLNWGFGRSHTSKVPFSPNHIKGTHYLYDLPFSRLTFITCVMQRLAGFSNVKWPRPFCVDDTLGVWEGRHYVHPTVEWWGILLHLLKGRVATEIIWSCSTH